MKKGLFCIACLIVVTISPASASEPPDASGLSALEYYSENLPPYNYLEAGVVRGRSMELLRRAWARLGVPEKDINILPWARAMDSAMTDPQGVLFSTARLPSREDMFKWACPFPSEPLVMVGRQDSIPAAELCLDGYPVRVGVVRGGAAYEVVKSSCGDKLIPEVANSAEHNVRKLVEKRLDYIVVTERYLMSAQNRHELQGLRVIRQLGEISMCMAFNKAVPDQVVNSFRRAFDGISRY